MSNELKNLIQLKTSL